MKKKPTDVYFWEFARRFLEEVVDQHKPSSQANYKSILGSLTLEFGHLRMSQIDRRDIQIYFTGLAKDHAPATVRQYWTILNSLLAYAEDHGLIEEIRKPKLPRKLRKPQAWWTLEQMRTLINGTVGPMRILVMVLAETGCRISEALALQSKHVANGKLQIEQNFSAGVLTTPKTNSSFRGLTLSTELWYGLSELKVNQPNCYIFRNLNGDPFSKSEIRHAFGKVCDRLRLPRSAFHAFRRGNITLCESLEIREKITGRRVGHLTGKLTLDVYVQKLDDYDVEAVGKIAEALYATNLRVLPETNIHHHHQSTPVLEIDVAGQVLQA